MPLPRHRRDSNHDAIVQALRDVHALVYDVHGLGIDLLDLIAIRAAEVFFLEIKDGAKPPGARRLTAAEEETIRQLAAVGVEAHVVLSVEDALRAVGAIL